MSKVKRAGRRAKSRQTPDDQTDFGVGLPEIHTHIEARHEESTGFDRVWMLCGVVAVIGPDGALLTPWADFYVPPHGSNATCPDCLAAWRQRVTP